MYVTGAGRSERWRWAKHGKHSSWSVSADCHDDLRIVATGALCSYAFVPNATNHGWKPRSASPTTFASVTGTLGAAATALP